MARAKAARHFEVTFAIRLRCGQEQDGVHGPTIGSAKFKPCGTDTQDAGNVFAFLQNCVWNHQTFGEARGFVRFSLEHLLHKLFLRNRGFHGGCVKLRRERTNHFFPGRPETLTEI